MIEFLKRNAVFFFLGWHIGDFYGTDYFSMGIFIVIFVLLMIIHDLAIEDAAEDKLIKALGKVIEGKTNE